MLFCSAPRKQAEVQAADPQHGRAAPRLTAVPRLEPDCPGCRPAASSPLGKPSAGVFRACSWGPNFVRPIGSTAESCLSPFSRLAPGDLTASQLSRVGGRWHWHPLATAGCGSHAQWGTWLCLRLCLHSDPESCLSWVY